MENFKKLLLCPCCKNEFNIKNDRLECLCCGRSVLFHDGILDLAKNEKVEPRKCLRQETIRKIKNRLFHPTYNFPFSDFTKKRVNRFYENCLKDKNTSRNFRQKYLPVEYRINKGLVLDFGCGKGRHSAMLSQCGFDIVGIDPCAHDYWKRIVNASFIRGKESDLEFFKYGTFDIVLCMQVLMYIEDDNSVIRDLYGVLKKGGFLILQVTNKDNLRTKFTKKWLIDEPIKRYYAIEGIISKLKDNGFVILESWTEKMYFPFFTQFVQFILEILLPEKIYDILSKLTPARFRGIINISAQKN